MELPNGWRECPQHSGCCFLVPNWPGSGRSGVYYSFSYRGISREEAIQKTAERRAQGLGEDIPVYVPEIRVEVKPRPVAVKKSKDDFGMDSLPKPKQMGLFDE